MRAIFIQKRSHGIIKNGLSLKGLRILNTRPKDQASDLSRAIQYAGGFAIELPTLAIEPTNQSWMNQLPALATVHQAIFISPNAVRYFMAAITQAHINWPHSILITAIGHGTTRTLQSHHLLVNHIPDIADSEHLLTMDHLQSVANQSILLIKGTGGRDLIERTLQTRGAHLEILNVYQRALPDKITEYALSLWRDDAVDIILFTSEQAMQNLFALFGQQASDWIRSKPCIVISQRLATAARQLGIQKVTIYRLKDMIEGYENESQRG